MCGSGSAYFTVQGVFCILYICIILLLVEGQILERSVDLHICAGNNVDTRYEQFIHLKSG